MVLVCLLGLNSIPNKNRLKCCYYRFSVQKLPNITIFQSVQYPKPPEQTCHGGSRAGLVCHKILF